MLEGKGRYTAPTMHCCNPDYGCRPPLLGSAGSAGSAYALSVYMMRLQPVFLLSCEPVNNRVQPSAPTNQQSRLLKQTRQSVHARV